MARPRNPAPAVGDDLRHLEAEWAERGPAAIQAIRESDPTAFLWLIANALREGEED